MFKAKKVYWLAQIGGWFILSMLLFASSLAYSEKNGPVKAISNELILSILIFFLLGIVLTHAMRSCFLAFGWLNLKLGPLVPRAVIASFFFAALMSLGTNLLAHWLKPEENPLKWLNFLLDVCVTSMFFTLWNSVYFTFHFFQRSREQEVSNLQLTASHNEIELKNLRSQLNPHFLFNSLNSIRALIELDPKQAQINITKLSSLLRKSLILGKEQLVSLSEELAIVQDYLDLEKVRFEERVQVIQIHDSELSEMQIPPFILQTLVENAFKHGIAQRIQGGTIWISSEKIGEHVVLKVENTGTLNHEIGNGIGIENTIRRLELQFGSNASFELTSGERDSVIAQITLTIKA
jgi:hypothetical protein